MIIINEIYINADEHYYNLDTSNWPTYSNNEDTQGFLFDFDNNGTSDLVVFPLKVAIQVILKFTQQIKISQTKFL